MAIVINPPRVKRKTTTVSTPSLVIDKPFIESSVHNFIGGIIDGKSLGYGVPTLRASSFPYCPVLMAMTNPEGEAEYRSDFYFETGTAIHTLIQRWAAKADFTANLFGVWRCTGHQKFVSGEDLQKKHPPSVKPAHACPECEKAGVEAEWQYEEITVKWKGLSGHVDTVLEIAPGKYIVVDYKTTRFRTGGSPADRVKFPYGSNKVQITLYCTLLRELFGLDIVGWALVYIDRAQPMRGPRDYHVSTGEWDIEDHDAMMKVLSWANRSNIPAEKVLHNRLKGIIPTFDEMDEIVAQRPCKSIKKWEAWMKPKFLYEKEQMHNGHGACPHLEMCTSGNEDAIVDYFLGLCEDWEFGPEEEPAK